MTEDLIKSLTEYKSRMNEELDHIIDALRYQARKEKEVKELDELPFLPNLEPEPMFVKKHDEPTQFIKSLENITFDNLLKIGEV